MERLIALCVRLLSLAAVFVNFLYLQSGLAPNLNSYFAFIKPWAPWLIGGIILGSLILMVNQAVKFSLRLVLVVLIIVAMFPLYHPYLVKFFPLLSRFSH